MNKILKIIIAKYCNEIISVVTKFMKHYPCTNQVKKIITITENCWAAVVAVNKSFHNIQMDIFLVFCIVKRKATKCAYVQTNLNLYYIKASKKGVSLTQFLCIFMTSGNI